MNRKVKLFFVACLVSVFALSACSSNDTNSDALKETVENQVQIVGEAWDYTQEKMELLATEEKTDETVESINQATLELETRRIRIDKQLAALAQGGVVVDRDHVSFESELSEHAEIVETITTTWNAIASDFTLISEATAIDEDITASYDSISENIEALQTALTTLNDALAE